MTEKWFNLFDECAARSAHLSSLEEECPTSSGGDSKMYTSGSIATSQSMLYICPLRKKSAALLPEGTVKPTHLTQ